MMRGGKWWFVGVVAALLVPSASEAQPAWDSPMLMPPAVGDGFGIFLVDVEGGSLGAMVTWRAPSWNFGVRGGLAERGDEVGIFAGFDVNGILTRSTADFPLDMDWVFGAGLGIEDGVRISAPLGLSVGHVFTGDGVTFLPYVTPRVVLDAFLGDENDGEDDLDLELAVDLGLDLRFTPQFLIRFGGTIGDRDGVAIGLVF
jgi:hypothetical protein